MNGFLVGKDGEYAAIPFDKKGYLILHKGKQLERLCRTESSARKYISDHKKGKSVAKLPI